MILKRVNNNNNNNDDKSKISAPNESRALEEELHQVLCQLDLLAQWLPMTGKAPHRDWRPIHTEPWEDPKNGSTLGPCNLHHRNIGVQN